MRIHYMYPNYQYSEYLTTEKNSLIDPTACAELQINIMSNQV